RAVLPGVPVVAAAAVAAAAVAVPGLGVTRAVALAPAVPIPVAATVARGVARRSRDRAVGGAGGRAVGRLGRSVERDDDATAVTALALLRERLKQPGTDPLTGHLHEPERRHLGNLVLGPVPRQALKKPAQHELAVRLEHHVDEVDDDDTADVTQPELANDLLRGLQVVPGDGLLEVPALAGELAGVDVDDRHRLGTVDDQRAAARQPHL